MAASPSPLPTTNSSPNNIATAAAAATTTTCAFPHDSSKLSSNGNRNTRIASHTISCHGDQNHSTSISKNIGQPSTAKIDRRNMLVGLGGLCGVAGLSAEIAYAAEPTAAGEFPVILNQVSRTVVKRPKISRSKKEKEDDEEVLVIDIELAKDKFVKFDVYINDEDDPVSRPDNTEFAGSFVNVPQKQNKNGKKTKTCLRLGLTDLLEDLGAEDDDTVVVTLVPRSGAEDVNIGGIKIEFDA